MATDDNDLLREGRLPADPSLGAVPAEEPWPDPVPLDHRPDLPPFPIDILPPWMKRFVEEVSVATQTPPDLVAWQCLAAVSLTVAGVYDIRLNAGHVEPLNLWILAVLESGERKSPVVSKVYAPIYERERQLLMEHQEHAAKSAARLKRIEKQVERLSNKALDTEEDLREIERLLAERDVLSGRRLVRLTAEDATPEALETLLFEQNGRIGQISAEGADVIRALGQHGRGPARVSVHMRAYSGDHHQSDRITRTGHPLTRPLLTMALALQPGTLRGFVDRPEVQEQGFTARFIYAAPRGRVGTREADPPEASEATVAEYNRRLRALTELPFSNTNETTKLDLDAVGRKAMVEFKRSVEARLAAGGDLDGVRAWGGKLVGNVARVIGVLHAAAHAGGPIPLTIDEQTVAHVLRLADYLVAHAAVAMRLVAADGAVANASRILARLPRWKGPVVDLRDLYTRNFSAMSADDAKRAAEVLVEHGFWRPVDMPGARIGRPRAPRFLIHPRWRPPT